MKLRLNIRRKLILSFAAILLVVATGGNTALQHLRKNRVLFNTLVNVYEPTELALHDLYILIYRSKLLIKNWVFVDLKENTPDKMALQSLHLEKYPALKVRLMHLQQHWPDSVKNEMTQLNRLITDSLFVYHHQIMNTLQRFDDYNTPMRVFEASSLVQEETDPVNVLTNRILNDLERVIENVDAGFLDARQEMEASYANFRRYLIRAALIFVLGLVVIAFFTIQAVLVPVKKLSRVSREFGDGKSDARVIIESGDEMQQMGEAFNLMADKLVRHQHRLISINQQLTASEQMLKRINQTKDQFFSIIAHDLKGPFNGLVTVSQALAQDSEQLSAARKKQFIDNMYSTAVKLNRLIGNLLEWSRTQNSAIRLRTLKVNLRLLVQDAVDIYADRAREKAITIQLQIPATLFVLVDIDMVSAVLRNLLENAIKFSPSGGNVNIRASEQGNSTLVCVRDWGPGIAEADVQKLFRVGQDVSRIGRSVEKGTGLGLILCKEFVRLNGGRIWVESEVGKGSAFCFSVNAASHTDVKTPVARNQKRGETAINNG